MAAMRAPDVRNGVALERHIEDLRSRYPEIDGVLADVREALSYGDDLTHMPVDAVQFPGVYAVNANYTPLGADGRGRFRVTYHAGEPARNPMSEPCRTYTILTIKER